MKPKLAIIGAAGRVGKRILSIALENDNFDVVSAVENPDHPDIGSNAAALAGAKPANLLLTDKYPEKADVVIDFSLPLTTDATLENCVDIGAALVLGTTGLSQEQILKVEKTAESIPLLYGTNMSIGMNVLFLLAPKLAKMLGEDYDIEIIEQHHRFKKDAPSGSALTLAENICIETGHNFPDSLVYGRSGKDATRQKGQVGIHAIRAGDITGIHSAVFSTLGETIKLTHTAHSRDTFVRGALRAAKWLIGKEPGLYSMADCLGLPSRQSR